MSEQVHIYTVTHKLLELVPELPACYDWLLLGAERSPALIAVAAASSVAGVTGSHAVHADNTGDNISALNEAYGELTGLYWIWKNAPSGIVGFVQYHRFFCKLGPHFMFKKRYVTLFSRDFRIMSATTLLRCLNRGEMLVKFSPTCSEATNREHFYRVIGKDNFSIMEQVIHEKNPAYSAEFNVMARANTYMSCNMFVCEHTLMSRYCAWLFPVLKDIDNLHKKRCGKTYHKQELCHMAEFLFGVWLDTEQVDYIGVDVVDIAQDYPVESVVPFYRLLYTYIDRHLHKPRS